MRKNEFLLSLILLFTFSLFLVACGGSSDDDNGNEANEEEGSEGESDFSIAMVTDTGGVDDRSFNQSAWEGMQEWAEEHGFGDDSVVYYQSEAENDYVPNLNTATTDGHDVIYGIGFLLEDPIATIAEQNPDRMYGIVDSVVDMENVVSLNFNRSEERRVVKNSRFR